MQARYKRSVEDVLGYDEMRKKLIVMIAPTIPFCLTGEEVHADPIDINARLSTFARFANVLDVAAVAFIYEIGEENIWCNYTLTCVC